MGDDDAGNAARKTRTVRKVFGRLRHWTSITQGLVLSSKYSASACADDIKNIPHKEKDAIFGAILDHISEFIRASKSGQSTSVADVNEVWDAALTKLSDPTREDKAQLAELFVDLSTSPRQFALTQRGSSERRTQRIARERVFLVGPQSDRLSDPADESDNFELTNFADSVANSKRSGVICLAGVRGTGKSTVLNRIKSAIDSKEFDKRPVCSRLDIGLNFDAGRFALDLVQHICRDVRTHFKNQSAGPIRWWEALWRFMGNVGGWCRSNVAWAAGLFVVMLIGLAIDNEWGKGEGISHLLITPDQGKESAIWLPLIVPVVIFMVGCFHEIGWHLCEWSAGRRSGTGLARQIYRSIVFVSFIVIVVTDLSSIDDKRTIVPSAHTTAPSAGDDKGAPQNGEGQAGDTFPSLIDVVHWYREQPLVLSWLWLFCIVLIPSQLALPAWWPAYARCKALQHELAEQDSSSPSLSLGGELAKFLGFLLPRPILKAKLRDQETAFVQMATREFLERMTPYVPSIALLIDDVDVLPGKSFHDLLRLLRPCSKVPKVCCVVSVPDYFFFDIRSGKLDDLHSTAAECYLLGFEGMTIDDKGNFNTTKLGPDRLREILEDVLSNRSHVLLRRGESIKELGPLKYLIDLWGLNGKEIPQDGLKWFEDIGPSLRELIRETKRLAIDNDAKPFDHARLEQRKKFGARFKIAKEHFGDMENRLKPTEDTDK